MKQFVLWGFIGTAFAISAAVNWHLALTGPDISPVLNSDAAVPARDNGSFAAINLKAPNLTQASARPLFAVNRKPWVQPAPQQMPDPIPQPFDNPVPEPPAVTEPLDARLLGIQRTPTGVKALIADNSGVAPEWLRAGASYREWRIGDIASTSVTLERDDKTQKLELYPQSGGGSATP